MGCAWLKSVVRARRYGRRAFDPPSRMSRATRFRPTLTPSALRSACTRGDPQVFLLRSERHANTCHEELVRDRALRGRGPLPPRMVPGWQDADRITHESQRILASMASNTGVPHRDSLAKYTATFVANCRSWRNVAFSREVAAAPARASPPPRRLAGRPTGGPTPAAAPGEARDHGQPVSYSRPPPGVHSSGGQHPARTRQ